MTQIEWQQLEATVAQMTEAEKQRLSALLANKSDLPATKQSRDLVTGLFADKPELIDEIMAGVYRDRHYSVCDQANGRDQPRTE